MATCFIFTKYLHENGCLITRFNDQGELDLEVKEYSFAEIKMLQKGYETRLIYPSTQVSLINLEMPWLAERKARAAIPYALEDKLAQPIELLHFAFDKQYYKNNQYEIVVIEKKQILDLIAQFTAVNIEFDSITLDWYALEDNEALFINNTAIVHSKAFKGTLSSELIEVFQNIFADCTNFIFPDSENSIDIPNVHRIEVPSYIWISQRLLNLKTKSLNLCQGELQHSTSAVEIKRGYRYLAGFASLWVVLVLVLNAYKLYLVNSQLAIVDQQIANIYRKFFPEAKQIINPKFRINQLLGATANNSSNFWDLIHLLAKAIKNTSIIIEQFRYQNKILVITVICPDFTSLEKLEEQLKRLKLTVTQTQAANRDQQVVATLELK